MNNHKIFLVSLLLLLQVTTISACEKADINPEASNSLKVFAEQGMFADRETITWPGRGYFRTIEKCLNAQETAQVGQLLPSFPNSGSAKKAIKDFLEEKADAVSPSISSALSSHCNAEQLACLQAYKSLTYPALKKANPDVNLLPAESLAEALSRYSFDREAIVQFIDKHKFALFCFREKMDLDLLHQINIQIFTNHSL